MKNVIFTAILSFGLLLMNIVSLRQTNAIIKTEMITEKFDIKIKNDTDEDVKVINAGSGGSYSLTKGATTPIKMEVGDKLYHYNSGKKGALILTATADMDGKVQLLSKL